jgi:hypothetical protein
MPAAGDPLVSSDTIAVEDYTIRKPLVRLVQAVAQALTNNTDAAITFTTEDIDTHGFHDNATNNSRITPSLAGYYQVTGRVVFSGDNDFTILQARIARNGSVQAAIERNLNPGTSSSAGRAASASGIFSANGTTDYFELWGLQANTSAAATPTNIGGSFASTLECIFLRPL